MSVDGASLVATGNQLLIGTWTLPAGRRLDWRESEGEFAVFSEADDSVHLLTDDSAALFSVLLSAEAALTARQLAQLLIDSCEEATPLDAVIDMLQELLPAFQRLGLAVQLHHDA